MAKPKEITRNGKTYHCSVGALIEMDEKCLLIDRAIPPLGFAGVAGHVDEGENQEQALAREVEEEVGLKIDNHRLFFEELVEWNWCSKGVTGHYWYLYKCSVSGAIKQNYRETKSIKWCTQEEIKKLKLEPVWDYWFRKLKII